MLVKHNKVDDLTICAMSKELLPWVQWHARQQQIREKNVCHSETKPLDGLIVTMKCVFESADHREDHQDGHVAHQTASLALMPPSWTASILGYSLSMPTTDWPLEACQCKHVEQPDQLVLCLEKDKTAQQSPTTVTVLSSLISLVCWKDKRQNHRLPTSYKHPFAVESLALKYSTHNPYPIQKGQPSPFNDVDNIKHGQWQL